MTSYIPEHVYGRPWPLHLARSQDIELTKKGEAYVGLAEADGVFFLTINRNDRTSIATTIERLINILDAMDGDENLESTADEEPWLGWPTGHGPAQLFRDMPQDDREQDDSDAEDGHDDEPTLGWERGSVPYDQTHIISDAFFDECEEVSEDEGADINHQPQDGDELEEDAAEYDCPGLIWGGTTVQERSNPTPDCGFALPTPHLG
jgi:hypothetical protein